MTIILLTLSVLAATLAAAALPAPSDGASVAHATDDCITSPADPDRGRRPLCENPSGEHDGVTYTPQVSLVGEPLATPGATATVQVSGWVPNGQINVRFNDAGYLPSITSGVIHTATANAAGDASFTVTLPTQEDFDYIEENFGTEHGHWLRFLGSNPAVSFYRYLAPQTPPASSSTTTTTTAPGATTTTTTVPAPEPPPTTPPDDEPVIVSVDPARLADTRAADSTVDGQGAGGGRQEAGSVVTIQVAGRGGVPADAGAAVLNVTVTETTGYGYVTVWPCDAPRPEASTLNYLAGMTVANAAVAKLAVDGTACVYVAEAAAQVIVDVNGYVPTAAAFEPLTPARLVDTRAGAPTVDGVAAGEGAPGAGGTLALQVAGRGGVAPDAAAVAINVTVTGADGWGYVTAWPCDAARPEASSLNYDADATVANAAVTRLSTDGQVCLYTAEAATDVIVDVTGWFPAGEGLTSLNPTRVLDTRPGAATIDGAALGAGLVEPGTIVTVPAAGRGTIPTTASAAVVNVTSTGATGWGYATVLPCGQAVPNASNVNFDTDLTVAGMAIAPIDADGNICVYVAEAASHLVIDVTATLE